MPLTRRVPALALTTALIALLSAAPPSAHAEDGGVAWTVQTADNGNGAGRANFSYDVEPGTVLADTMIVVNTGTEPLPLAVYAADAFTASSGEIDVLVDGTPSQGAGTWVRVDTGGLQLAPGQSADVPFTVSVPADARPGDHTAGIVTSLTTTDASSSLSVDRRLGTRINLRVAGELAPAAAVSEVRAEYHPTWNPFAAGTLTVRYALENTGNTRVTGAETVSTTGTLGLLGTSTPPAQLSEVVPGSTVEIARDIPAFSIGWISGSVRVAPEGVGLGAGSVDEVVVDFAVPAVPWSLYALVVLIAAVTVVLVLVIRRRGASRRPGDAQAT
ncbi:DUF916 domain-containing protein [Microbacterium sp. VKM Ac-2923]|uniref:DUF916 domain-containing protein n=1 Tax=Microbacterium sp. VKM Ac-2923 TaxID=2929476 RepID=UPI001FB3A84C|nr:DUF916 domain-containing protein [Microbacterium sp. VKM Ac-2923]MCJ1708793.1 DUF916 domain-containing protein [Microbacterium sp. VKM Ac-2923]